MAVWRIESPVLLLHSPFSLILWITCILPGWNTLDFYWLLFVVQLHLAQSHYFYRFTCMDSIVLHLFIRIAMGNLVKNKYCYGKAFALHAGERDLSPIHLNCHGRDLEVKNWARVVTSHISYKEIKKKYTQIMWIIGRALCIIMENRSRTVLWVF